MNTQRYRHIYSIISDNLSRIYLENAELSLGYAFASRTVMLFLNVMLITLIPIPTCVSCLYFLFGFSGPEYATFLHYQTQGLNSQRPVGQTNFNQRFTSLSVIKIAETDTEKPRFLKRTSQ